MRGFVQRIFVRLSEIVFQASCNSEFVDGASPCRCIRRREQTEHASRLVRAQCVDEQQRRRCLASCAFQLAARNFGAEQSVDVKLDGKRAAAKRSKNGWNETKQTIGGSRSAPVRYNQSPVGEHGVRPLARCALAQCAGTCAPKKRRTTATVGANRSCVPPIAADFDSVGFDDEFARRQLGASSERRS